MSTAYGIRFMILASSQKNTGLKFGCKNKKLDKHLVSTYQAVNSAVQSAWRRIRVRLLFLRVYPR